MRDDVKERETATLGSGRGVSRRRLESASGSPLPRSPDRRQGSEGKGVQDRCQASGSVACSSLSRRRGVVSGLPPPDRVDGTGEMPVWWVPLLRPSARVCRLLQRSCRLPVVHGGTGGTSAQTVEGQGAARDLAGQRSCWREACHMIGEVLNPKLWGGGPVHPSPPAFQPEKRN